MPYNNGYNGYNNPYGGAPYFQRPLIPGKIINNPTEVLPQDVPMDGSVGLYPVQDHSCIYAKAWKQDGTIATVKYVPEQPASTSTEATSATSLEALSDKLDRIERMLKQRGGNRKNNREGKNESTVVD